LSPEPKNCWGTSGADVLKSTSKNNNMFGKGGNDTYTHFVRGNSGRDVIADSGGRDKLVLTNYSKSEVKPYAVDYVNNNGKPDSLGLKLGKGSQNTVIIVYFYNDKRSKPPWRFGPGYIEDIQFK
jgi:Ca2+-binding RTX toxin-like protein